jgi:hypothetical protein
MTSKSPSVFFVHRYQLSLYDLYYVYLAPCCNIHSCAIKTILLYIRLVQCCNIYPCTYDRYVISGCACTTNAIYCTSVSTVHLSLTSTIVVARYCTINACMISMISTRLPSKLYYLFLHDQYYMYSTVYIFLLYILCSPV